MFLAGAFLVTALLYACVGFGGGSTYNAILVLAETDYRVLPAIALLCNIIVVTGGVWHFHKAGHIELKRILPWILVSVPAAWLGGMIYISEVVFTGLLGVLLLLSGIRLLWPESSMKHRELPGVLQHRFFQPALGGGLGLIAGLTGIGGGIFLAPVLHLLQWAEARVIAGTCSLFILVNSVSGLAGQLMKQGGADVFAQLPAYWMLFPAVLIGGQAGSRLGATFINAKVVRGLTALLVLFVSVRLLYRWTVMF